jgi:hypothetical protein
MLHHNTSTVIVFQSIEYRNFIMIKGNRNLDEVKINRIIKEIENGNDVLIYYPILVTAKNEKLEIFDGQHRFFISKKLKRPVHYIIINEQKSMSDIAKVNSNVAKWNRQDFINCYITNGNDHYKKLQPFLDEYKMSVGTSLRLLTNGSPGAEGSNPELAEKFEHGLFEVGAWDKAVDFAEECRLFNVSPFYLDRSFIIAIYRIKQAGLIPITDLAAAVKKHPELLEKQVNYKTYIINLEAIINKNKQKRIVIT